jgi:hypothetical protein
MADQIPKGMQSVFDAVISVTDDFCSKHLNDDYKTLCRRAAAALCRKRPSPLSAGKIDGWACGIIYALGKVNFLFDPSQTPHLSAKEVCSLMGVGLSTGSAKAKEVLKSLKAHQFDPNWCTPSNLEINPLAWMIQVDGIIMDARMLPVTTQQQLVACGVIPYVNARETE